ncbi:hypothetical protein [Nocardia salmonicida]|uniref:hypothetical protein n=1 Tax=Nocardia salmonicida TaxID=53431 RepID=UPI00343B3DBA
MPIVQFVGPLVGVIGFCFAVYAFKYNKRRKRLVVKAMYSKLITGHTGQLSDQIHVKYGDLDISDPHLVNITVWNVGAKDILAKDFDGDKPLKIEIGATVVALLQPDGPTLNSLVVADAVSIQPSLLVAGRRYVIPALVDGEPNTSVETSRIADTDILDKPQRQALKDRRDKLFKYPARVALVLGFAFMIAGVIAAATTGDEKREFQENRRTEILDSISYPANREQVSVAADQLNDAEDSFQGSEIVAILLTGMFVSYGSFLLLGWGETAYDRRHHLV